MILRVLRLSHLGDLPLLIGGFVQLDPHSKGFFMLFLSSQDGVPHDSEVPEVTRSVPVRAFTPDPRPSIS